MNLSRICSVRPLLLLVAAGGIAMCVPRSIGPIAAHAQTATIGTPVSVCGPVASYTAATATGTGTLTISNVNTNQTFTLPAGTSFAGNPTLTTGTNICVVGSVNSAGQLVDARIIPNTGSTVNLCGPVTAYIPATLTSLGSLTIGGQVVSLGLGTTFTGATVATGSNVCIAANVNSLGVVNSGAVTANTAGATGSTLVNICGPISTYTAATATTAGSITFSTVGVTATYKIPAGTTTTGGLTLTTGTNVCLVGTAGSGGALTSATLMTNTPTQVYTCGRVSAYTAATVSALGSITIGGASIPLGLGTTFTGGTVTLGTSQCFTLTMDALGQAVSGTIATPLAAVLYTPHAGWLAARLHAGMPI